MANVTTAKARDSSAPERLAPIAAANKEHIKKIDKGPPTIPTSALILAHLFFFIFPTPLTVKSI